MKTPITLLASILPMLLPAASPWEAYYDIEDIPLPPDNAGEVGGLDVLPDGRLAVAFFREGVWIHQPGDGSWAPFAEGLHEPLGLIALNNREILVMQRPELTRLVDEDGDGSADLYQTVCDDFGISGNYHEFAFGPVRDPNGNFLMGLNAASNGDKIFPEVRGEYRPLGRNGRMYSCVPYRGWILQVSPSGEMRPYASGFRSPNGLGFDADGRLYVTDNQGDWIGTSPLHQVKKGAFHGHVASLVWEEGWTRDPLAMPEAELDEMRRLPCLQFPHSILANSPTQPLPDLTGGKFGPFAKQLFVGEMNHSYLLRCMLEEVAGEVQGAAVPFLRGAGLKNGGNRMVFAPDHSLILGYTKRNKGWSGDTGLVRIRWKGVTPPDVASVHLTDTGFEIGFTMALDTATPASGILRRYYYEYHRQYGSPQFGKADLEAAWEWHDDGRSLGVNVPGLEPGFVYEINLPAAKTADGTPVLNTQVFYTLNVLPNGRRAPPRIPDTRDPDDPAGAKKK